MPAHTASTIVAEDVSGSHVLTVRGYSHTAGHGAGKSIRSGSFSVGGHTWDMEYYPDGFHLGSDWISIGLIHHQTEARMVKVRCRFSLLDQLRKPVPKYTTPYWTRTWVAPRDGAICGKFIKRNELEKSMYLKDDCFSFKCEFTVTNIRTEEVTPPPSDMHEQLARILETGKVADVTFEVGGDTFAAHWCLLAARSSVFMAQFLSVKENAATSVSIIDDMDPRVFKDMLQFIYTDSLPKIDDDDEETIKMLFAAADRYDLQKLKLICENMLCNRVDTSTVITALAFAEQHGCLELKKACFQFLASSQNLMAIVGSDAFENLKTTQPNILEELVANVDTPPPDMLISSSEPIILATPAHTSSTIVAECVSGSHVLTVKGYSKTVGLGVCRGIPSGIFSVGGHTWKIVYCPDGCDASCNDCVSVFLLPHPTTRDATNVKVRCRFSLLDQVGEPVPEYTTAQGYTTRFPRFITREALENSAYLRDDCFSIRCDVSVTKGIRTQPATQPTTLPPPTMLHQFGRMLETGVGADVIFEVAGETFAAHRHLLAARSSVFMAQLFGPAKANDATTRIQINDMEAKVFRMMLQFIYTDTMPSIDDGETTEMAQHLFVAADRYNLERLKLICTNMLRSRIDAVTVAAMLAFAEQHGCDGLKKACFKFLASSQYLNTAAASDSFEHLKTIRPNILEELLAQDW
ncbi:unnamed protein product [Alopecurus aequalis]